MEEPQSQKGRHSAKVKSRDPNAGAFVAFGEDHESGAERHSVDRGEASIEQCIGEQPGPPVRRLETAVDEGIYAGGGDGRERGHVGDGDREERHAAEDIEGLDAVGGGGHPTEANIPPRPVGGSSRAAT
jgi:hypothetical protein